MAYTDADIEASRRANNVPDEAIAVRTSSGGFIFINPNQPGAQESIRRYQTGELTGGPEEVAGQSGTVLRSLPPAPPPPPAPVYTPLPQPPIALPPAPTPTPPAPPPQVPQPGPTVIEVTTERDYEARSQFVINFTVRPAVPAFPVPGFKTRQTSLRIVPVPVRLRQAFQNIMKDLLSGKVDSFFDEERVMKTVLNFGNDYQTIMTNWMYDPRDKRNATILAKLYRPLPPEVAVQDEVWISRELAPTVIDRIFADYAVVEPPKLYLRPPNRDVKITGRNGSNIDNQNLRTLLSSGSFDLVRPSDPVLEEWFSYDVNQTELNIKYNDYRNFVFFGSAANKLTAFVNKLKTIENLDKIIALNSSSLAGTGSAFITGSLPYLSVKKLADERLDLVRSFDPYERFLYYQSGSAYSSSPVTNDREDEIYFHEDATWPKIGGVVAPVASASAWLERQLEIATAYDQFNQNALINTIPQYLKNDDQSQEFLTFLNLVGHHFDELKTYIDAMDVIYDRQSDPAEGMAPDLVWNLAESVGIELPNQYAVKSLVDYTIGEVGTVSPKVYRQVAAETWKRFLHNQIYTMKTKGTKASLRALANTYGILPTTLEIRESATPGTDGNIPNFEIFEEQTNALDLVLPAYIRIPWATSSLDNLTTQLRFATTSTTGSVLFNGSTWAIALQPLTGSFGRVELRNASNVTVASSSYFEVFSGEFFSVMVRKNPSNISFYVKRAEGEDIVDNFETTIPSASLDLSSSAFMNLGGSGSFYGPAFVGYIDEFRVWGEVTSDETFDEQVRYPGLYNGNTTTSTRDALWVRLSFNKPQNLGVSSSIPNESPYARQLLPSNPLKAFTAVGFPNQPQYPNSMEVITREVLRYAPNAGASQFSTNKVIIVDDAQPLTFGDTGIPVLSPKKSMVPVSQKIDNGNRPTNIVGFFFSVTDAINDNIIRSLGTIDLQDLLGDPADQFNTNYTILEQLNQLYWDSYAYNYNINSFVDFVRDLLGPMFKQARQLIPVRAKLLGGIVHEPHILERNKLKNRPMNVTAGRLTRDTSDTQNLEATPIERDGFIVFGGEVDDLNANFIMDDIYDAFAENPQYEGTLVQSDILEVSADNPTYEGDAILVDEDIIFADYATFDEQTNLVNFTQDLLSRYGVSSVLELSELQKAELSRLLAAYRSPSSIDFGQLLEDSKKKADATLPVENFFPTVVNPVSDFDDLAAYSYFTDPNGLWSVPGIDYVRVNQSVLRDRGTWTTGTAYSRNDFVLQTGEVGDATNGNDLEFVCVATDDQFISYVPPFLDTAHWKAMKYVPVESRVLKEVILYSGSVSVAPSGSLYENPIGYQPQHYRNARDMRRGILNPRWYGCIQTDTSTTDGKPAVETTFTAGDRLVVSNPGEPVQPQNNQVGPILDVQ